MLPSRWIVLRLASVTRNACVVWSVPEFASVTADPEELFDDEYKKNARRIKTASMSIPDRVLFFLKKSIRITGANKS